MGEQIDMLMDRAAYFTRRIKSTPGYEMVIADVRAFVVCKSTSLLITAAISQHLLLVRAAELATTEQGGEDGVLGQGDSLQRSSRYDNNLFSDCAKDQRAHDGARHDNGRVPA